MTHEEGKSESPAARESSTGFFIFLLLGVKIMQAVGWLAVVVWSTLFTTFATGMTMTLYPRWVANRIMPKRRRRLSQAIEITGFLLVITSFLAIYLMAARVIRN